jgi:hypothetical protein
LAQTIVEFCELTISASSHTPTHSLRYTNDKAEITPIIATLFAAQDTLYRAGARNFLFIDVPPLYMSPIGKWVISTGAEE